MSNVNLPPNLAENLTALTKSLHEHWRLFVVEGVVLIILGAAAIIVPPVAGVAIDIFLGWLFFIGGAFSLVMTIVNRQTPGFWWALFSAALAIAAGAYLIGRPTIGVISLTFILTAFLVADGMIMIMYAIEHHRQLSQRWGWLLLNGLIDLALAGVIVLALPQSAIWALGIIVGVDMLFGGFSLIAIALAAREKM